jgi:hypothetical protein
MVDQGRGAAYGAGSEQAAWLAADLQASAGSRCVMAVWHNPRFLSTDTAGFNERSTQRAVWQQLYDAGVDVVLNGGVHLYERMQPMDAAGAVDTVRGIRQFNVGVGGESRYTTERLFIHPNSAARGFEFGVLKLTLKKDGYDWQFLPVAGATVIALGDNAFPGGTAQAYNDCYGPTWGRFKDRTYAVLGNHDWDSASASFAGALSYFGDRAGPAGKHYYSFDVGTWHVVVLNVISGTNPPVPYNSTSEQQAWLAADLQANAGKRCTMVVWHDPRFMSAVSDPSFMQRTTQVSLWSRLEGAGVDVVVNGNQHWYERMHPMRSDGTRDDANGITQFIVGTGGESVVMPAHAHPNTAAQGAVYGVLRLTLRDGSYDWAFLPARGQAAVDDSGSRACH